MLDHWVTLDKLLTLSGPLPSALDLWPLGSLPLCIPGPCSPPNVTVCHPQLEVSQAGPTTASACGGPCPASHSHSREREEPEEHVTYEVKQTREKENKKHKPELEGKSCEGIWNGGCQAGADPINENGRECVHSTHTAGANELPWSWPQVTKGRKQSCQGIAEGAWGGE